LKSLTFDLRIDQLQPPPVRILAALPAMAVKVMIEIVDCRSIKSLARRVSGNASVGLKAKPVVKAIYR